MVLVSATLQPYHLYHIVFWDVGKYEMDRKAVMVSTPNEVERGKLDNSVQINANHQTGTDHVHSEATI